MINILVVDDSALMRKLLGGIFGAEPDCAVRFARNGLEALEQIARDPPDVVTLDVHMPQMDGIACLDRIMIEHPCPVVMLSSLTATGADATLAALRLGAVDFIAKPDGAISLSIDDMASELVAKVRAAAGAKIRTTLRLQERVRHRVSQMGVARPIMAPAQAMPAGRAADTNADVARGEGLVLVGTSTGGPPALEALLTALPGDFPWPIVIAQHMPGSFTGPLARRLDRICATTIMEVAQLTPLRAGGVYIGRGDADIIISRRTSGLVAMPIPSQADYPWHPSTDRLVRSAMDCLPPRQLIGVLMTGMGNDGASAMALLHSQGGRTIAESEATAVIWGMPGELVRAGGADWVLPLPEIAGRLRRLMA